MNTQNVAEKFAAIYQTLAFDELDTLFTENFIAHGTHMPAPMNQAQFVGFLTILTTACSDMNFNPRISDVSGNTFKLNWQLTGTHTDTLKLSVIGMSDFEATNRSFSLPEDVYTITVDGDKVRKIEISPVEGGGIQGVIQQLGLV